MRLSDFEGMVRRMASELPADFLEGVAEVAVSPRSVPHPTRAEIYTLGECIPLPAPEGDRAGTVQSRIVLYHGSFQALARLDPDFDWREEAWETLTHELRHHVEWRARAPALEAYDRAVEENFARHEGERFDPLFFVDGGSPVPGVYEVDGDYFLDRIVPVPPEAIELEWHGAGYRAAAPPGLTLPAYLSIDGVAEPPPGELVLVLRRKPRITDLFHRAGLFRATVRVDRALPGRARRG
ncbi:MAG TPA: metallopeptidase family protein [Gemmatimonadales bacterium]|nr:metallopeptidase family protein [Gemmatimonadales bacterium]